ncbi:hypothetical protein ARALYDRAFT_319243 [Arabidopsis lyrata subsp. lyrata]|uniref:FBD domain-containing protein n=1 Tax=Arabidopsis lyrata subsp. lyrata TaxID=81972 RepID=D7L7G1_ARALL|nr:hypothetical protein ARALYDRAFT_319243 [Arabidopsis lyrata subsp. lyrata]
MAKILSGCPSLERLKLCFCNALKILDLNKSMRLRTLEINSDPQFPRTLQIVAPYIHCLILKSSHHLPCVLVDVSSLVEARLNISIASVSKTKNDSLQVMVLNMLEKLQNVEKLTFVGGNLLKILSMAELRGVPFPMFKFKSLTLERVIFRYVIPGIERVLKNSPNLKKLHTKDCYHKQRVYLGDYVDLQAFNLDQCWRSKYGEVCQSTLFHSWTLRLKIQRHYIRQDGLLLEDHYLRFKELVPTLPHNCNVSVALYTKP